jgi:hypothetical protein
MYRPSCPRLFTWIQFENRRARHSSAFLIEQVAAPPCTASLPELPAKLHTRKDDLQTRRHGIDEFKNAPSLRSARSLCHSHFLCGCLPPNTLSSIPMMPLPPLGTMLSR